MKARLTAHEHYEQHPDVYHEKGRGEINYYISILMYHLLCGLPTAVCVYTERSEEKTLVYGQVSFD